MANQQVVYDGNGNMFTLINGVLTPLTTNQPNNAGGQPGFVPNTPGAQPVKNDFQTEFKGDIRGHLGADPVFRTAKSGTLCCNFNVAVNDVYKGVKETTWFHVCCFGKTAEMQQGKLRKGSWVIVPVHRVKDVKWTDNQQVERYSKEFHARRIIWLDKKPQDNAYVQPGNQNPQYTDMTSHNRGNADMSAFNENGTYAGM
jgi:single stranded DNA-binding protein